MSNSAETNLVRKIMLELGKNPKIRIFRNNVGSGYIGASKSFTHPQTVNVKSGDWCNKLVFLKQDYVPEAPTL